MSGHVSERHVGGGRRGVKGYQRCDIYTKKSGKWDQGPTTGPCTIMAIKSEKKGTKMVNGIDSKMRFRSWLRVTSRVLLYIPNLVPSATFTSSI